MKNIIVITDSAKIADVEFKSLRQKLMDKEDVIRVMKAHGNILIKKHGFWTYENCEFHKDHNSNIPIFSCQITTLRVLARRNIVTLDENKGICKLKFRR